MKVLRSLLSQRGLSPLVWACLIAASARANAVPSPCDAPPAKASDVAREAVFPVELTPYGRVCFLARKVAVPEYAENDYLQFELLQGGRTVATLSRPERYLWNGGCRVTAVSFPRLGRSEQRSIVILGQCTTAKDELAQPLIYRGTGQGFALDTALSLDSTGLDSIAKVLARVKKTGAAGH